MTQIRLSLFLFLYNIMTTTPAAQAGLLRGQTTRSSSSSSSSSSSVKRRLLQQEQEELVSAASTTTNSREQPMPTSYFSFPQGFFGRQTNANTNNQDTYYYYDGLWDRKEKILRPSYYYYEEYNNNNVVSSAPTRDLCYGNMERLAYKKFCHSEMPSVSLEPTQQPTVVPPNSGGDREDDGGGNPTAPSWDGTDVPSLVPLPPTEPPTSSPPLTPSSIFPSPSPTTLQPSINDIPHSSTMIGMCAGDCDSPTDCEEGLYCYQRMNLEAVPGCPGIGEADASRTDYCTNVTRSSTIEPAPPPTTDDEDNDDDSFRLQLYWNESYGWQESHEEIEWCMACLKQNPSIVPPPPNNTASTTGQQQPPCRQGDALYLHYCSHDESVVYFDMVGVGVGVGGLGEEEGHDSSSRLIQVVETELCLEHGNGGTTLEVCDATNPLQHWNMQPPSSSSSSSLGDQEEEGPFEITVPTPPPSSLEDMLLCLTTHHHPKLGEEVELFPCTVARHDNSSLWVALF